ncbi:hypothetical protein NDU88_001865 [Pleurodeles waltl]|uniref:Uncharacterized protein n=1 Tax=Pleurodeles waltl TaxID=8319 RepID=A0AAV7U9B2_PLEWA|nr:hypothetical protein NDU88_001865 [Pleurodeles waltl]
MKKRLSQSSERQQSQTHALNRTRVRMPLEPEAGRFKRVGPTNSGDDAKSSEDYEDDTGGAHMPQMDRDEAQLENRGGVRQESGKTGPSELRVGQPRELAGRSEKYSLGPNPTPGQRLRDFMC